MFNSQNNAFRVISLGLVALGASSLSAQAQTLSGTYWKAPSSSISTIADAEQYMTNNSINGSFTATENTLASGYSGSDSQSVLEFLGTDSTSFHGKDLGMSDGILNFAGYLNVGSAGTYNFSTTSDDGSALYIDGQQVVLNDGVHANQTVDGLDFLSTGKHTLDVEYFNHNFYNVGQARLSATFDGLSVAPVPEGSTVVLFSIVGIGLAGVMLVCRRRKLEGSAA